MAVRALLIMLALLVAGCAAPAPEPVRVPVYARRVPPVELMAGLPGPGPVLVAPDAPGVVAGLTEAGLTALVDALAAARQRLEAWRAWVE